MARAEAKPRGERRHVLAPVLQRIARRNQPPDFVEAERLHRGQAHAPVARWAGLKLAAKKADARHAVWLARDPPRGVRGGEGVGMGEFEAIGEAVTGGLLARAVEPRAGEAGRTGIRTSTTASIAAPT